MVKFVFPDAREWKYIIESLATIVDEANFVASPEGLKLRALDPGRIAMVDLFIPSNLFEEYSVDQETKISAVLDDIDKVLKRAKSDDKISFEVSQGRLIITLSGRAERRFKFPLIDIAGQELPSPKLNFTVAAKMLSDTFRDALKDASLVSESVKLKAEDESLWLLARSDKGEIESRFSIETGSLVEIDVKEAAEASYGIDFLDKIVSKAYRISDILGLRFATNMPLEMTFDIAGGGTLKYLLAPRME
ncbi:proliferating cell nuclear antigen (pcna) [Thermofilum pendens]|uniref:DNA polymerase sliding clamp n=1 Tax=Thermofilum pendens (strain DSM 2475 / Hrk 5) TaxID=368408 RepID=PCNA_THEPD|nr:proliferating cell nuclear antigen (pcna) [Thermofilum pendens]A1RXU8.1 RecName: Full=DNA polymerase sliding clamp; AltName: Full=Proliferating cell nuclear antigen homolog; Short=PCNA [Thermofilum pendens Hrk 5]ABL78028.1 monomeric archaeal DNA polymerase sliding clamp [Thermofilum pendens Hrk 5]